MKNKHLNDHILGLKDHILVCLLFLMFAVTGFGQKYSKGQQSIFSGRIAPHSQLRKGTKPNQVLMSLGDSTLKYVDADSAAMIMNVSNIPIAGKVLFVDSTFGNNTTAMRGYINYPWASIKSASNFASNNDLVNVWPGSYSYATGDSLFQGKSTAFLNLNKGATVDLGLQSLGNLRKTNISITGNGYLKNTLGSWASIFTNDYTYNDGEINIEADNFYGTAPIFDSNYDRISVNIKDVSINSGNGLIGYITSPVGANININVDNLYSTSTATAGWSPGFIEMNAAVGYPASNSKLTVNIGNAETNKRISKLFTIGSSSEESTNNSIVYNVGNFRQVNKDSLSVPYDPSTLDLGVFSFTNNDVSGIFTRVKTMLNCNNFVSDMALQSFYYLNTFNECVFVFDIDNCTNRKMPTINMIAGNTFNNCKIILKGNYTNTSGYPILKIEGAALSNTQIILEGNFTSSGKVVECLSATLDANSAIILNGTATTTSASLPAIDVNYSRFVLNGSIITGGGFSIDNTLNNAIDCVIKPTSCTNYAPSGDVTQLGGTILVNSNFNK